MPRAVTDYVLYSPYRPRTWPGEPLDQTSGRWSVALASVVGMGPSVRLGLEQPRPTGPGGVRGTLEGTSDRTDARHEDSRADRLW